MGAAVVARVDAAPVLEFAEHVLDPVALAIEYGRGCQSNANRSPADTALPFPGKLQAMRFCHSARAAERRVL